MINYDHKFIFIHIPRTGGTSIEAQFGYMETADKHANLKHWKDNWDMYSKNGKYKYDEFFKFTFIRSPWSIMVSKYVAPFYSKINSLTGKTFLYFLQNYYKPKHEAGDSFHEYFDPGEMDFIGRFETREKSLHHISNKINFTIDSKFSVKAKEMQKARSNKHYTEYYDDETIKLVAEIYDKDIEYFGYEFGNYKI